MHSTRILLPVVFVLLASTNSFAARLDKVEVCHFSATQVKLKSVSENALSGHLSHGDVLASEVDNCELPPVAFCLELHYYEGLGYPEYSQFLNVNYYPSTGEVFNSSWPLQGSVFPIGQPEHSIYTVGATFSFLAPDLGGGGWDWMGAGLSNDTSGTFVGFWAGVEGSNFEEGTAPTDYTFTEGYCE